MAGCGLLRRTVWPFLHVTVHPSALSRRLGAASARRLRRGVASGYLCHQQRCQLHVPFAIAQAPPVPRPMKGGVFFLELFSACMTMVPSRPNYRFLRPERHPTTGLRTRAVEHAFKRRGICRAGGRGSGPRAAKRCPRHCLLHGPGWHRSTCKAWPVSHCCGTTCPSGPTASCSVGVGWRNSSTRSTLSRVLHAAASATATRSGQSGTEWRPSRL